MIPHISRRKEPPIISFYQLFDCKDNANVLNSKIKSAISSQTLRIRTLLGKIVHQTLYKPQYLSLKYVDSCQAS